MDIFKVDNNIISQFAYIWVLWLQKYHGCKDIGMDMGENFKNNENFYKFNMRFMWMLQQTLIVKTTMKWYIYNEWMDDKPDKQCLSFFLARAKWALFRQYIKIMPIMSNKINTKMMPYDIQTHEMYSKYG